MSWLNKFLGDPNKRVVDKLTPIVASINAHEEQYTHLTNEELKEFTAQFKERLANGDATLDTLLPEAFAACREAAKRTLGQRHFDVQLMGSTILHRGQIAEMRTGEGKTLTATLSIYLNALAGKGVHVVTVNDYLARRDAVWMGQIFAALGLSSASIQHEIAYRYDPTAHNAAAKDEEALEHEVDEVGGFKVEYQFLTQCTRKEAYLADITYGTNNEFGFDYLRDNLAANIEDKVQRDLYYAIVDEVDSILVDEARTPLIISAPAEESSEQYYQFAKLVAKLVAKDDYNVDEKMRAATLTDAGLNKMEEFLGLGNVYTPQHVKTVHHIEQALKAHTLFKRDKEYVVVDGEVVIVDEHTGRMMQGRRYSEGLHQAIEAKENVKIQRESRTYATITFQNYFRLYTKLAGMTGTAATEAEEFAKIYKLEVVTIPTHREAIRKDLPDRIFSTREGKYKAVAAEIARRHEKGQPVLVGTISIEQNEILGMLLERQGVPHKVLNAKNHEKEAEIIAQAGHKGGVTIATNMAGRGVDILLGGNPPDKAEADEVRKLGGLFVIGTERHDSRRIDNQLRGRSGRQGDPGESQFYLSMDDDLLRIFGSDRMKSVMSTMGLPEDEPIEHKLITRSIGEAQKKVETHNFDIRKHVVEYDDVINKQRETIYKKRNDVLRSYAEDRDAMLAGELVPGQRRLRGIVLEMVEKELADVVAFHTSMGQWDMQEIVNTALTVCAVPEEIKSEILAMKGGEGDKMHDAEGRTHIVKLLTGTTLAAYTHFEEQVQAQVAGIGQQINPWAAIHGLEKDLLIRAIDGIWIEHLEAIDHLRAGIGLRGYGQRDPLVEYKREAYRLFTETLSLINKQITYSIFKIGVAMNSVPTATMRVDDAEPKLSDNGDVIEGEARLLPPEEVKQSKMGG